MSRSVWIVVAGAGYLLATGCGDSKATESADAVRKRGLTEIGQMLKDLPADNRKPPTRLAELEAIEPMIPTGGPMIRSGDIVYLWGAGHVAGGTRVVAYEKSVPSDGGYVLLEDGTVQKMTAGEFGSATKAK
jgi:hypothetical protein